jgi:hypothetical protein
MIFSEVSEGMIGGGFAVFAGTAPIFTRGVEVDWEKLRKLGPKRRVSTVVETGFARPRSKTPENI